jgi:tRNA nucleotidyltransferase (CCA-adding enzyme)
MSDPETIYEDVSEHVPELVTYLRWLLVDPESTNYGGYFKGQWLYDDVDYDVLHSLECAYNCEIIERYKHKIHGNRVYYYFVKIGEKEYYLGIQ